MTIKTTLIKREIYGTKQCGGSGSAVKWLEKKSKLLILNIMHGFWYPELANTNWGKLQ